MVQSYLLTLKNPTTTQCTVLMACLEWKTWTGIMRNYRRNTLGGRHQWIFMATIQTSFLSGHQMSSLILPPCWHLHNVNISFTELFINLFKELVTFHVNYLISKHLWLVHAMSAQWCASIFIVSLISLWLFYVNLIINLCRQQQVIIYIVKSGTVKVLRAT